MACIMSRFSLLEPKWTDNWRSPLKMTQLSLGSLHSPFLDRSRTAFLDRRSRHKLLPIAFAEIKSMQMMGAFELVQKLACMFLFIFDARVRITRATALLTTTKNVHYKIYPGSYFYSVRAGPMFLTERIGSHRLSFETFHTQEPGASACTACKMRNW
jgi:hypothetical protein